MNNKRITAFASIFLIILGFGLVFSSCKISPRTVKGRTIIADLDPIETAVLTAQFENFMGTSINPAQLTVSFAPRTDEALLKFKSHANHYEVYLHSEARKLIREAARQYNEDFDARRLDSGLAKRKSEMIYGRVDGCFMRWGLGTLAMNGEATPRIAVGYRFEKGSPYFAITVYRATNPLYKQGKSNIEESVTYHIYMNKAQAEALAQELDEGVLMRALDTINQPSIEPDRYEYTDADRADTYGGDAPPVQSDVSSIIEEDIEDDEDEGAAAPVFIESDETDAY